MSLIKNKVPGISSQSEPARLIQPAVPAITPQQINEGVSKGPVKAPSEQEES